MYYKKLEHQTNKKQILMSLRRFNIIKSKFILLKSIINAVGITSKIAQYYSTWIEKSQVFQVKRKKDIESNFLLLSFVYHQYLIRNDNLMDRFISVVQTAKNSSVRSQKEFSFEQEPKKITLINSFIDDGLALFNELDIILQNTKLSSQNQVKIMKELVENKKKIFTDTVSSREATQHSTNKIKYDFIEQKSISLQGKLSGIVKAIEFDEKTSNKNIITAINYFKNNPVITNKAPQEFLNDDEIKIIFNSDKFRV